MKKYTVISLAFVFGMFIMTSAFSQLDDGREKTPISVTDLPEEVKEAIQEDYEGYRIQEAFKVTRQSGAEVQSEGAYGTQHEGMQQGAERTGTQREGVQGAERTGTQHEGMQQGTERTGTQREGMQGAERTGTQQGAQTQRGTQQSGSEGVMEGLFSSDDEDTYYELVLAKGQESKTVKYNDNGDELDKEDKEDKEDNEGMQYR